MHFYWFPPVTNCRVWGALVEWLHAVTQLRAKGPWTSPSVPIISMWETFKTRFVAFRADGKQVLQWALCLTRFASRSLTRYLYNLCFPPLLWMSSAHCCGKMYTYMNLKKKRKKGRPLGKEPVTVMYLHSSPSCHYALLVFICSLEKWPLVPKRLCLKISVILWLNPGFSFVQWHPFNSAVLSWLHLVVPDLKSQLLCSVFWHH